VPEGEISIDDPRADDVRALLERHLAFARSISPPEDVHALEVDSLLDPAVTFFSFRLDGALLAVAALKQLDRRHAELKSMHTAQAARGRGIGRAMVDHLLAVARDRGFRRVSLETGSQPAFSSARSLYASAGFSPCGAFGDYRPGPNSSFMTLSLDAPVPAPQRRKRRPDAAGDELSRSQRRDQAAREALAPLAPGERPKALLVAAAVAGLLGAGNAIAYIAGAKIDGKHPGASVLAFSGLMALLCGGMVARRYLAVLAFEGLLALAVLLFSLFLVEAANIEGVLLCVAVICGGGWLFWKLVRVMGRLSAPRQSSG
jgi:putative acetyltransferase